MQRLGALLVLCVGLVAGACSSDPGSPEPMPPAPMLETGPFLDTVQTRTFEFFWETTNTENGLVPDRWPDPPFSSVAATPSAWSAAT